MTTDWWSTAPEQPDTGKPQKAQIPRQRPPVPDSEAPPTQEVPEQGEHAQSDQGGSPGTPHSKAVRVVGGVACALTVGLFALHGISGGGDSPSKPSTATRQEGLPAAGGGPGDTLPAAGAAPVQPQPAEPSATAAPEVVTLKATPSGKGRVGAVMQVTIHNGTRQPVTVLATMMKGDGRPAIVGEGTLAPGSRTVQPGETVTGTVEFSAVAAPHQVALLDLSGNVLAASDEN